MSLRITYRGFGGPEVLSLDEAPELVAGPGQVRVRTVRVGINPTDAKIRAGEMEKIFPVTFPVCPGTDVAGVIDAVGADVTEFAVGDAVFGTAASGAYAEYAVLNAPVAKPSAMSWETAAALPMAGETAVRALRATGVVAGQTLLVHGAMGGVGSIVTQLAVHDQITVIGTVGEADIDDLQALGATAVRYGEGWAERVRAVAPNGVDAVLDTAGRGVLPESIALTGDARRVVTLADAAAFALGAVFTGADPNDRARDALPLLAEMVATGRLAVRIGHSYPLADAAIAHRDLASGVRRGKLLLDTSR